MTSPGKPSGPNRWIWPFELIEQIGEGGMGVVYRARYVVNNREVALKMVPGDVTDKVALARFERELEVLKNLKHPNIVRCFGGVSEDKQRFYAMELVAGGSLEDELQRRGRFSPDLLVTYGLQMCAGLECSHKNGVIHRDIKPSNFLISKDQQLKLSDFGLASVAASRRITAAGKTAGTILYMAPEQIRGGELSPQTDLYALGCVFYELLTGKPPFIGDAPAQTMHMHCRAEIPKVSATILDCPLILDNLITQMLAKDVAHRPTSAVEVARVLRSINSTITIKIDPKRQLLEGGSNLSQKPAAHKKVDVAQPTARSARRSRFEKSIITALFAALVGSLTWIMAHKADSSRAEKLEAQWIQAAEDPDLEMRLRAIKTLGELDGESVPAVTAIGKALEDKNPLVRMTAINALSRSGAAAKTFITPLARMGREDQDHEARKIAELAATRLKDAPDSGIPWTWLILLTLAGTLGTATFFWVRRDENPGESPSPDDLGEI